MPSGLTAGFADIEVEGTRTYDIADARAFLATDGLDVGAMADEVKDKVVSARIRARKPVACCGPSCCS